MGKVFISYSWETTEHNEKVISFVNFLRKKGFNATCDIIKMQEESAIHFKEMIAKELNSAEKVIIVLSRGYKEKADKFSGGVGSEFRYIVDDIERIPNKYICVSFERLNQSVISQIAPDFIKGREIVDLCKDEDDEFKKLFSKLLDIGEYVFEKVSDQIEIAPKKVEEFTLKSKQEVKSDDIDMFSDNTPFFDYRVGKAFPGVRGIKWFDNPNEAIKRLAILLHNPLSSKGLSDPILFFRGSSCLYIKRFEIIDDEKCLIGFDECKVNRIAIYKSSDYYRSFVYVELKAENPVGVNEAIDDEYISRRVRDFGYANEEYAVYEGRPITRTEYDDDAAVINGEVIDLDGKAEIRIRYLSKYNFVICAKFHPFNSQLGDKLTKTCLNQMLKDEISFEEFVNMAEKLPRHRED